LFSYFFHVGSPDICSGAGLCLEIHLAILSV
jgi:hypothetical protein